MTPYRCVDSADDRQRYQLEIDRLGEWSRTWQLHFNMDKCKIMHIGKKNVKETYMMGDMVLESTADEKDIEVMIQDNLKPSIHCAKVEAKANGVLGQLSRAVLYPVHESVPGLCKTNFRVLYPGSRALHSSRQALPGEGPDEGCQNCEQHWLWWLHREADQAKVVNFGREVMEGGHDTDLEDNIRQGQGQHRHFV